MSVPSTTKEKSIVPTVGEKHKDKGKESSRGACKKMKVHRETHVYALIND
jgi:hypothetical protein